MSSKLEKLLFATISGCVDISWAAHAVSSPAVLLVQTHVGLDLEKRKAPPITVTVERGDLVISPGPVDKDFDAHPANQKTSRMDADGAYEPGYLGDHSNVLQWMMNAIIYAEVEDIPRVRLNSHVHQFLRDDMLPGLPTVIDVDRKKGRMVKDPITSSCGIIWWDQCRVDISVRAEVAEYYFKQYMPADCGDPRYGGLVVHLRRPEYKLPDYMQPPCHLYAAIIEEGKYASIRVFGESQNPCAEWLTNYTKDHNIDMQFLVGRSFKDDFCEAARAKNYVMGTSTMSQNAVLLGGRQGRHLYQLLPPNIGDPFLYFGLAGGYFKQLCDVFDTTGFTLDDATYWDMSLDMKAKMVSPALGIKATPCKNK